MKEPKNPPPMDIHVATITADQVRSYLIGNGNVTAAGWEQALAYRVGDHVQAAIKMKVPLLITVSSNGVVEITRPVHFDVLGGEESG